MAFRRIVSFLFCVLFTFPLFAKGAEDDTADLPVWQEKEIPSWGIVRIRLDTSAPWYITVPRECVVETAFADEAELILYTWPGESETAEVRSGEIEGAYVIVPLRTGEVVFPDLVLELRRESGQSESFIWPLPPININLAAEGQTELIDITGVQEVKGLPRQTAVIILIVSAVLVIAAAVLKLVKALGSGKTEPYDDALVRMKLLENCLQEMDGKEFIYQLTALFHEYVDRRFDLNTTSLTTKEFLDYWQKSDWAEILPAGDWKRFWKNAISVRYRSDYFTDVNPLSDLESVKGWIEQLEEEHKRKKEGDE